jgi:integrase
MGQRVHVWCTYGTAGLASLKRDQKRTSTMTLETPKGWAAANPHSPSRDGDPSTKTASERPRSRRAKLTLAMLKHALGQGQREPSIIFDTELPGLALHVALKRAFWTFTYSPHGTNPATGKRWGSTRLELGEVAVTTLPEARRLALTAKAAVKAGRDPQREKAAARRSSSSARGMARPAAATTGDALALYETALVTAPTETVRRKSSEKTRKQAVAYARKAVRLMQAEGAPPDVIDATGLRRMLDGLSASDAERRHVFGGLQRFMAWCCKRGLAAANPCNGFDRDERPKPGKARDNAPDLKTLRNVWRAVENEAPSIRDLLRFLLLAPLRRDEAAGLRWSETDLERGWIRIDGDRMKNGEPHELPLSAPALAMLKARHEEWSLRRSRANRGEARSHSPKTGAAEQAEEIDALVFPTPEAGEALQSWTRLTARVRRAIGHDALPPDRQFRWHDIRRSFVTHLADGSDEAALDAMLAHRRKGVAGVYQKQKYLNRRPAIMARWAEMLTGATSTASERTQDGRGSDHASDAVSNVVPLRAAVGG